MSPARRGVAARAGLHVGVHATVFLLTAISLVYLTVHIPMPAIVTVPVTIGTLSITPALGRRILRPLEGLSTDGPKPRSPTASPTT